jgi:hypothetical protein
MGSTTRRMAQAGLLVIVSWSILTGFAQSAAPAGVTEQAAQPLVVDAAEPEPTSKTDPATPGTTSSPTSGCTDPVLDSVPTDSAPDEQASQSLEETTAPAPPNDDSTGAPSPAPPPADPSPDPADQESGDDSQRQGEEEPDGEGTAPPPTPTPSPSLEPPLAPAPAPGTDPGQQTNQPGGTIGTSPPTTPTDSPGSGVVGGEEVSFPNGHRDEFRYEPDWGCDCKLKPPARNPTSPVRRAHRVTPDGATTGTSPEQRRNRTARGSEPADSQPGERESSQEAEGGDGRPPVAGVSLPARLRVQDDQDEWSAVAGLVMLLLALLAVRLGRRVEPQ